MLGGSRPNPFCKAYILHSTLVTVHGLGGIEFFRRDYSPAMGWLDKPLQLRSGRHSLANSYDHCTIFHRKVLVSCLLRICALTDS